MSANLGEATTKELLEEISSRMRCSLPSNACRRDLMFLCDGALDYLSEDDLTYRTVDSS